MIDTIVYLASLLLVLISNYSIIRTLVEVDRYYDFRNRILRDIYLTKEDLNELVRASNFLQECLETYGPTYGRETAREVLST